jgi:hypothetical protein
MASTIPLGNPDLPRSASKTNLANGIIQRLDFPDTALQNHVSAQSEPAWLIIKHPLLLSRHPNLDSFHRL